MGNFEKRIPEEMREMSKRSIILPEDPEIIAKLKNKLSEYKSRLEARKQSEYYKDGFKAPEQIFGHIAHTHYKIAVLETLLRENRVDREDLLKTLSEQDPYSDSALYYDAFNVIKDYCETGGKYNAGGAGF